MPHLTCPLFVLLLVLLGNQGLMAQAAVPADLSRLLSSDIHREVERLEALEAGGKHRRRFQALELDNLDLQVGKPLRLEVQALPATMEVAPALISLPTDWHDYAGLRLTIKAHTACRLRLSAVHVNGPLSIQADLAEGHPTTLVLPLLDLPLASANEEPYRLMGIRLEVLEADDPGRFGLDFIALELQPAAPDQDRACVDRYGQRLSTTWPGKVRSDADLWQDREEEAEGLRPGPGGRSRFGGWLEGPRHQATGFFRVERADDGTWWFIDPEGYRFWSAGITCVNIGSDQTKVGGREFLYAELPDELPETEAGEPYINFFAQNVARKYDSLEQWRQRTLDRLESWGINTIGNWSNPATMRPGRVAYTRYLYTRTSEAPMATRRFADIFDPRWQTWFDDFLAREAAVHRDDPWLLGYFVDNELPWLNMGLLNADPNSALKQAWAAMVRDELLDLDEARAIWGERIADWSSLRQLTERDCPDDTRAGALRDAFEHYYADRYFHTVSEGIKKHDPNHLYLGCRFVRRAPHPAIVEAAGRYSDVVTVNCYAWEPGEEQFGEWHRRTGRPILIGEHHISLASPRQVPPPWPSFSAAERERYYVNFIEVWAGRPYSLGCHYFQLIDQPPTGRFDGENRTIGWLDITDQPHAELVRAAQRVLPHLYDHHQSANPKSPIDRP